MNLALDWVRSQFPAFNQPEHEGASFFENAGGSHIVRHTIDALGYWYQRKTQPYAGFEPSRLLGEAMDASHARWAAALGVGAEEVHFGPSTSANTYALAPAIEQLVRPGDEIIVTNQDHEANTGAIRRMAARRQGVLREWRTDPETGLLDPADYEDLLSDKTRLVTFPHASNVVGMENDVARLTALAHSAGARVIVDGVSYAPHAIPDVGTLNCDVYLFSLYKVYSVHQGLMVAQNGLIDEVENQGHYFNEPIPGKRLTPAGPDHVQIAAAAAVLDYIEETAEHHGISDVYLGVSALWQAHEDDLLEPLLAALVELPVRVLGTTSVGGDGHRCPTVAFVPDDPAELAAELNAQGVMTASGHFYAYRVLEGLGIDPETGVVRLSFLHYTSPEDIDRAIEALTRALS